MNGDGRTPVVVGVGAADQRFDDPADGVEAIELMARAADAALADAGPGAAAGLRRRIAWIGVPEGTWAYGDPGRLVAERLGLAHAEGVHTVLADVGVVQQDLLTVAAQRIAAGELDVALVVGGEAKYRQLRGTITGVEVGETIQPDGTEPTERWRPESLAVLDLEIIRNTVTPVAAYALIERAIGHARAVVDGRSPDEHRDAVADLWASFAAVAASNPRAWDRSGPAAPEIRDPGPGNRMISFPYTKRLAAQWNVDQAAAIVLCSTDVAAELGVARDRWVFPHASTVSNLARSVAERREVHRSIGAEVGGAPGARAGRHRRRGPRAGRRLQLLPVRGRAARRCPRPPARRPRPAADRHRRADLRRWAAQQLRPAGHGPAGRAAASGPRPPGLSSSVSGFLVKQAFSIWQAAPPAGGFRHEDVTAAATERFVADQVVDVVDTTGTAVTGTVVTATVDHTDGDPARGVALVDLPDGTRTIAVTFDANAATALVDADPIGWPVAVSADGTLELTG